MKLGGSSEYAIKTILSANDAQLKAAFGDAGNAVQKLGKHLQEQAEKSESKWGKFKEHFKEAFSFGGVAKLGAMAGEKLVEGLQEAAKAIPEFAEKAEEIGRTSKTLGMTAEAYQRVSYAAKMADLPQEQLIGSMEKLNKSMGQMHAHTGAMYKAVSALNPELASQLVNTHDSVGAMLAMADAVKATTDPQKRAALATAAFGKAGQDMIPFLMQGKDKIMEVMGETEKYGDVLSNDTVEAGGRFSDSMKRITASLESLKNTALSGIMEAINPIVESMAEWIAANKGMIQSGITNVIGTLVKMFGHLAPVINKIVGTLLPELGKVLNNLGPIFDTVFTVAGEIIEALTPIIGTLADVFVSLAPAIDFAASIIKAVLIPAIQLLKPVFEIVGKYINGSIMVWSQTIGRLIEGILQGVSAVGKAMGQDMSAVDGMITSLQKMRDSSTAAIFGGPADKTMSATQQAGYSMGPKANTQQANQPTQNTQQANNYASPNSGKVGLQANTSVVNQINVNGIPGAQVTTKQKTASSASQNRPAPALSGYGR